MALPTVDSLTIPLLQLASDEREHTLREAISVVAEQLCLGEKERQEMLPSGRQTKLEKRVGWAKMHLTKAGLLESTGRGRFVITRNGLSMLREGKERLTAKYLTSVNKNDNH